MENPLKDLHDIKRKTFLKDFKMNKTSQSEMYNMNTFMSIQNTFRKMSNRHIFYNTYQVPFFLTPRGQETNDFYKRKSEKMSKDLYNQKNKYVFSKKANSTSSLHKSQNSKKSSVKINGNTPEKLPSVKRLESCELKSISKKSISVDKEMFKEKPKNPQQKQTKSK